MRILFVTWDGPQTNYLQSLFLPIFSQLESQGFHFSVLQFSWATQEQISYNSECCKKMGIAYRHINVWRKPSVSIGSMLTALKGSLDVRKAIKNWDINIVIPRSTLPALATMLAIKNAPNVKLLFDADGLPLDERVDFANANSTSLVHRFLRDIENQAVIRADGVITRSKLANGILQNRAGSGCKLDKFSVVTNGRDTTKFKTYPSESRLQVRKLLEVRKEDPLIVYAGSLGPQYCMKQMLQFFKEVKAQLPLTRLLILSGDHKPFESILEDSQYLSDGIILKSLESDEVGKYLSACDVGLAIRETSFSMQGVAPIKLGEYLLCGLPVVATKGIGDTDMLTKEVGFLLESNSKAEITKSVNWFVNNFKQLKFDQKIANDIGLNNFSVEFSVQQYKQALHKI